MTATAPCGVRRHPHGGARMETYLLMAFFLCLFGSLFILIFFAVNAEERHARAKERPQVSEEPAATIRRRHLHTS